MNSRWLSYLIFRTQICRSILCALGWRPVHVHRNMRLIILVLDMRAYGSIWLTALGCDEYCASDERICIEQECLADLRSECRIPSTSPIPNLINFHSGIQPWIIVCGTNTPVSITSIYSPKSFSQLYGFALFKLTDTPKPNNGHSLNEEVERDRYNSHIFGAFRGAHILFHCANCIPSDAQYQHC